MSVYSKPNNGDSNMTMINDSIANTQTSLGDDSEGDSLILSSYDRNELDAREVFLQQFAQRQKSEIAAQEHKAFADSLRDQSELTGSDLSADANPRQLHLF